MQQTKTRTHIELVKPGALAVLAEYVDCMGMMGRWGLWGSWGCWRWDVVDRARLCFPLYSNHTQTSGEASLIDTNSITNKVLKKKQAD